MEKFILSDREIDEINSLVKDLTHQYSSVEDDDFLKDVLIIAHELPKRIRRFINDFRLLEPSSGVCVISGYPISDEKIGKTPSHWQYRPEISPALEEEIVFMLFGSLLGEVIGWSTQQAGHIVHDVIPIKGHEHEQLGSSSKELLWWHNEDAFHPYRGDYLGMMCLRNKEKAATTVAPVDAAYCLNPDEIAILFEPRFTIRPDESHLVKNQSDSQKTQANNNNLLSSAYHKISNINSEPEKISVFYGDPKCPYVRIDPYFMDMDKLENDNEALTTLTKLMKSIDINLTDLVLQPGDFCFIDNYKTVHGRKPYTTIYDGQHRWLKRIIIARDLRKSRSARPTATSRIIF
ncbi:guanitoxin biosynthesis L-enduracididine beta-hydroxylase GntD [Nostoc sp. 'Lobaria pulmonaria (5183) cyanobiont']|uniref:guanitoxin biosynthesis L-enduracididine beta-hydroxylase GntD n=1 Tax=Nostoc sp. 'Lobaria pulmonaria (5183) cyanobiont' TaxID=1618022 RepID=UPI000CF35743|nr:guanitoxin biosynthesis L-enduracididine beta-hydroxylase GntD [Nostoc sp. 'Lobaria pulmonaria (5183) cyanobiont']AVH69218.1 Fe(II)/alpha-ketoglutarate-dependent arginine beta-hydroxylase [Nostoc sp. 'Lobaria pulmonaria (5183) cyanobiont']